MSPRRKPSRGGGPAADDTPDEASAYPPGVRRRWSDAFAGAGLFGLALQVCPAPAETPPSTRELVHRAELAVLANTNDVALALLKPARGSDDDPVQPAVLLMTAVARAQAGEKGAWAEVQKAAADLPELPWRDWMVALGGVTVPDLAVAGPAARRALDGGCRDPRLAVIAAAGVVVDGDELGWEQCAQAVSILERARRVQLPSEDALGGTLELLRRAGRDDRAAALAAFAVSDSQVTPVAQDAWRAAAKRLDIAVPRKRLRLGTADLPILPITLPRVRQREEARARNLTCRCAGSTGWIGPDREFYVENHLQLVDEQPVEGLEASLRRCPLTSTRFFDLPGLELTLPVDLG